MGAEAGVKYRLLLRGECVRRRFWLPARRLVLRVSPSRTVIPRPRLAICDRALLAPTGSAVAVCSGVRQVAYALTLDRAFVRGYLRECGSVSPGRLTSDEPQRDAGTLVTKPRAIQAQAAKPATAASPIRTESVPLAQRLYIALSPPLSLFLSSTGPLEWPADLREFQKEGVALLVKQPVVLLADDMGLGKTIQAVAAMRILALRGVVERVLVVAPASVLSHWCCELAKWAPELKVLQISGPREQRCWKWRANVHVKVVSYETLRSDIQSLTGPTAPTSKWDVVCLDEAQRIKNRDSGISLAARRLSAVRRWALTGTPVENSLDDVRTILSFLQPSEADRASIFAADEREIRDRLKRVQLRRNKSQVLPDLPPKRTTEIFVSLTRDQKEEYDRLVTSGVMELRDKANGVSVEDVLALITRLKQVCNFSFRTGRSSKLDDLIGRLRALSQEGHKALIFSQFTSDQCGVRKLAHELAQFKPCIYTGDMSLDERRRAVESFKQDPHCRALILSLRAGGLGLNLQAASYVFHFDRWWNPATESQAEDRSHRIGQTRGVNVYRYVCKDTIEERIHEILTAKRSLFAEYVDDISLDLRQSLTEEEIFGLFGLKPPRRRQEGARRDFGAISTTQLLEHVRRHLEQLGYQVGITQAARSLGVDLVAKHVDELGIQTRLAVRCVNQSSPAGPDAIHELSGALLQDRGNVLGLVVCPAGFTDEAKRLACAKQIALWRAVERTTPSRSDRV